MAEESLFVINSTLKIPRAEIQFEFSRSGGPGGQNVNKVNSKTTLRWNLQENQSLPEALRNRLRSLAGRRLTDKGELLLVGQRYRDQPKNIEDCLERLRELVLQASTIPRKRVKTKPTKGSIRRRLTDKKAESQKKQSRQRKFLDD